MQWRYLGPRARFCPCGLPPPQNGGRCGDRTDGPAGMTMAAGTDKTVSAARTFTSYALTGKGMPGANSSYCDESGWTP